MPPLLHFMNGLQFPQNSQEECEIACAEVAELKKELLILLHKLQYSTPAKFSVPSIALHSVTAMPPKLDLSTALSETGKVDQALADGDIAKVYFV